ncbi:MAG: hypothetical protein AAGA93_13405 [Actinomycetota bacterium]
MSTTPGADNDTGRHPPAVRRVLEVLDELGPRVAVMSALDVAARAQVSDATVIRAARLLGHRGFDELKQVTVGGDWAARTDATIAEASGDGGGGASDPSPAARRIAEVARAVERSGPRAVPHLAAAVEALDDAMHVIIGGIGPAEGVAMTGATLLGRCGIAATATGATGRPLADRLVAVGRDDALVLFSFADSHPQLGAFQRCAAHVGCPLIVIGSEPPSTEGQPIVVPVGRGAATTLASLAPAIAVVEAMVVELMVADPDRVRRAASRLDHLRRS